ncbi:acyltransferase family protein [Thermodesulfobium narugense]|nr:acyltransferase family protein [Thermodesulfobium narugense]
MQKRIDWVDKARFYGIFWIAFGHTTYFSPEILIKYAYSFHLALFWFIAGFVFNPKFKMAPTQVFLRNIYRYIIPYFFFGILIYIYSIVILSSHRPNFLTYFTNLLIVKENQFTTPLWFLPALFFVSTLYDFILRFSKAKYIFLLVFIFCIFVGSQVEAISSSLKLFEDTQVLWLKAIRSYSILFFWGITAGFIWFGLGYFFKSSKFLNELLNSFLRIKKLLFPLFLLTLNVALFLLFDEFGIFNGSFLSNFFGYIVTFSGIFLWLYVSNITKNNNFMLYLGRNTLTIFTLHEAIFYFFQKVNEILFYHFGFPDLFITRKNFFIEECISGFSLTAISLILSVFIIWFLNKYFSIFLGKGIKS